MGAAPENPPAGFGSSGSRLLVTLLNRMEREGSRYGLATMCVGVGQGTATIIERV